MQRVRIPGGRITVSQLRALADLADRHTGGTDLHLTTRQDIEFHNVPEHLVETLQQSVALTGLTVRGAGGDSLRNITACPGCDLRGGGLDLGPLVQTVEAFLLSLPWIGSLPRKFKISFSCADHCAKPWLNDLGFVVAGEHAVTVIGAGSLGPRPALGVELARGLSVSQVPAYCLAALEIFNELGDRTHRRQARLRHVRQRLGDEAFIRLLNDRLQLKLREGNTPAATIGPAAPAPKMTTTFKPFCGELSTRLARSIADAASSHGAVLRINLDQGLEMFSDGPIELPLELEDLIQRPTLLVCPGNRSCPHGLVDTRQTAERILQSLRGSEFKDRRIAICGCSNHCVPAAVSSIGLSGHWITVDGVRKPAYQSYLGGQDGFDDGLAAPGELISEEAVFDWLRGRM